MTKCDLNIQGENMHEMAGRSEMAAKFDGLLPSRQPAREDVRHFQERMQRKSGGEATTLDAKKVDRSASTRHAFPSAPAVGSFWERIFGKRERPHSVETASEGRPDEVAIRPVDWDADESAMADEPGKSGERAHRPLDGSQATVDGSSGPSTAGSITAAVIRDGSETTISTARAGAPAARISGHGTPSGGMVTRPIFMGSRSGDGRLISRGGIATSRASIGRSNRRDNPEDIDPFFSQNPPVRTVSIRGRNLGRYGALSGIDPRGSGRPVRSAEPPSRQTVKDGLKDAEDAFQETPLAKVQERQERLPEGDGRQESEENLPSAVGERKQGQVLRHQPDSEDRDLQKAVKELRRTGETLDLSSRNRQDGGVKTLTSLSLAEDRYAARSTKIQNLLEEKSQFQFDRRTFDRRRTRGIDESKKHDDRTDLIVGLPQPNFFGVTAIERTPAAADLPHQSLRELCQQLVDQITVHQALLDSREEVHVQLKGSFFAGSEVVISRDSNGVLLVNFTVVDDQAGSLLVHNQQGLRDHLLDMLDLDMVRIEVQGQRDRPGEEDATDQRQGERRHSDQESPEEELAKIAED